jgi:hypothetical protein
LSISLLKQQCLQMDVVADVWAEQCVVPTGLAS